MQERWLACSTQLESEVPAQLFKTWIKPLTYLGYDEEGRVLRLGAPNQFKLNWVKTQFSNRILEIVNRLFAPNTTVFYELIQLPGIKIRSRPQAPPSDLHAFIEPEGAESCDNSSQAVSDAFSYSTVNERTRLRSDLSLDNFVTGKSNQMARAAALQVVERPGTAYNPLFLYGGVGLGKTHLIHAVGNAIIERNPQAKVRYIHAQEYFDEMVRSIQKKNPDGWKSSYQSLDLLLIDDIQFLSGKPRTQEEFFYTFEALFSARKQIIITCDTYPKEMSGVEERLISRFDSGLIVAIEPPEIETRVAILLKKAEQSAIELPKEVAEFIAKHLRSNVRELEGALLRVVAYAGFRQKKITLELSKEALNDLLSQNRRPISIETIQKEVADAFKVKVADMFSKRRQAHIVLPRQVAMYLAKELTQKSLPEIGDAFGGRDHTTVLHAVRKITREIQHDPELNHRVTVLSQTLRG